jgi:hypothetical protein
LDRVFELNQQINGQKRDKKNRRKKWQGKGLFPLTFLGFKKVFGMGFQKKVMAFFELPLPLLRN